MQQVEKTSGSFQLIRPVLLPQAHFPSQVRHADPSGWSRAYCFFACSASRSLSAILSSVQPLPVLRERSPPRKPDIFVARTTARTLYSKRNHISHNSAVNHPRDCLPCAHIVLRRHVHHALHPDSPRGSLYGSSRGSCTLITVGDVWREGYAPETP